MFRPVSEVCGELEVQAIEFHPPSSHQERQRKPSHPPPPPRLHHGPAGGKVCGPSPLGRPSRFRERKKIYLARARQTEGSEVPGLSLRHPPLASNSVMLTERTALRNYSQTVSLIFWISIGCAIQHLIIISPKEVTGSEIVGSIC